MWTAFSISLLSDRRSASFCFLFPPCTHWLPISKDKKGNNVPSAFIFRKDEYCLVPAPITTSLNRDIQSVWETVLCVKRYSRWRSDLSKTQVIHDGRFIEYTKDGFATHFTVTKTEPYRRWEFDLENSRIRGH